MTADTNGSIELPKPPLRAGSAEPALKDAPVYFCLTDGTKRRGRLQRLSIAREILTVRDEARHEDVELPLSSVKYIAFTRHFPRPGNASVCHELEAAEAEQPFRVRFVDRSSITGKTCGHLMDYGGLHLFPLVNDGELARVFVPRHAIGEYSIGPLLGETLVNDGLVEKGAVNEALQQQHELKHRKLGEYLLATTVVNTEQLKVALEQQGSVAAELSFGASPSVGEILLNNGWITQQQLDEALLAQKQDRHRKLGELLIASGAVDDERLHMAVAHKLGLPYIDLHQFEIQDEAVACIPGDIARKYRLIPLCFYRDRLVLAMDDPANVEAIDVARFISGHSLELATASATAIDQVIGLRYPALEADVAAAEEERFEAVGSEQKERALTRSEIERMGEDKPIVKMVNRLLLDAVRRKASDIHVRPLEERVELLFRIDGTLIKAATFSKPLLLAIVSRIKIIGRMDIAEHRVPQDGRARITDGKTVVDLRISVMPTINGESVVIRLLNSEAGLKTVAQLGFGARDSELFTDMLHKSYGMILVTGPTGSGKSTTLYAALQEVIKQNVNIITVENPVEYHIDGIEQIQVNVAQGYTFARALRNILRHDPDVIMIGEIRDEETGRIAVESALTGHLVLSTLHTNNAAGAVTRLLEMGVESFLLNATLLGVLAQRLVRRNCTHCTAEEAVDPAIRRVLGVAEDEVFFRGAGCEHCNNTGYAGRMAVYELLQFSSAMRGLINSAASAEAIHDLAVREGMTPLTENALAAARQRATSLAEVYRVRLA